MNEDFDIMSFLNGFKESKEDVINKYIKGLIDKDEFIRRMNNAKG